MRKRILLSICVPTYNRPLALKRLLTSLINQVTDEVELIIGDDGDFYETQKIVKEFSQYYNLIHFKNLDNPSFYTNLLSVTSRARGKYVWWLGDDDELLPNATLSVLNLIKKYQNISFIWANYVFDGSHGRVIKQNDGFFKDRDDVLETLGRDIGFMSSLIFRREDGIAILPVIRAKKSGLAFIHLAFIFYVLSGDGKFYFLKGPCVLCHPTIPEEFRQEAIKTGKIINNAFNIFGVDFYDIVMEFSKKFKKGSIRKLLAENLASVWRGVVVAWVGGWDTPKGKRWKMFKLYWSFPEVYIALLIFALPLSVNRFFYKVYKIFFDHRRWSFGKTGTDIKSSTT